MQGAPLPGKPPRDHSDLTQGISAALSLHLPMLLSWINRKESTQGSSRGVTGWLWGQNSSWMWGQSRSKPWRAAGRTHPRVGDNPLKVPVIGVATKKCSERFWSHPMRAPMASGGSRSHPALSPRICHPLAELSLPKSVPAVAEGNAPRAGPGLSGSN